MLCMHPKLYGSSFMLCSLVRISVKLQFIGIAVGFENAEWYRLSNPVCVCLLINSSFFQLTKVEEVFDFVLRNISFLPLDSFL